MRSEPPNPASIDTHTHSNLYMAIHRNSLSASLPKNIGPTDRQPCIINRKKKR